MFPTGNLIDELDVPNGLVAGGRLKATLINAGIPTIFVDAADIGYTGAELQEVINGDAAALKRFEALRAIGAVRMGLIASVDEASRRQHTPKIAFVAPARDHVVSSGRTVKAQEIDLLVRALSMGKLHHAMMGAAAVAIGAAAAVPGTLVNLAAGGGRAQRGPVRSSVRHVAGGGRGAAARRRLDRRQGRHEPQRASADGGRRLRAVGALSGLGGGKTSCDVSCLQHLH